MIRRPTAPHRVETTGESFRRFFETAIAPYVRLPNYLVGAGRIHECDDELAFSNLEHRLVVVPMLVNSPPLRILRHRYARTAEIDLLAIDLTRPTGPIECEIELFAPWRQQCMQIGHADMWLSAEGTVAIVPELERGHILDNGQPSVLWTPGGLTVADIDPFADEVERLIGVGRAAAALRQAEAEVAAGRKSQAAGVVG